MTILNQPPEVDASAKVTVKTRFEHRTLSSAIAEHLRQEIIGGQHAAGTQLRQDALAERFQVSRIPVREALFQLEAEGLLRMEPHRGAIVSSFSVEEIADIFDLRTLLEPRLLAASLPNMRDTDFAEVASLDDDFAQAVQANDMARWGELNAQFHISLYRHAPQPRTLSIVASLLQSSERFTRLQMNRQSAMVRASEDHHALLALCRQRASDEACAHLIDHIEKVRRDLLRLLSPPGGAQAARGPHRP